jgi:hypothetical protein
MAISLRKYEPQVRVSGEGTAVQLDPSLAMREASTEDLITADVVETLGGMASDFFKIKEEQKDKADIASYNNYKTEWASNLAIQKQQALLEGGVSQDQLYDTVVIPAQQQFNAWVNEQDFSPQISEQVGIDFDSTMQGVNTTEKLDILEHRINERNFTLQQDAENKELQAYIAQSNGNTKDAERLRAEANENWETLKATTKVGAVEGMRQTFTSNLLVREMRQAESMLFAGEITDEEYLNKLDEINSNGEELANEGKLGVSQFQTISNNVLSKKNNFYGVRKKELDQAVKTVETKIREDQLEPEDLVAIRNLNPTLADAFDSALKARLQTASASDDSAREVLNILNKLAVNGNYEESLRELADINSNYAEIGIFLSHNYAQDQANRENNFNGYTGLIGERNFAPDETFQDFISSVTYFAKQRPRGVADYIEEKLKGYYEWKKSSAETGISYEEFKSGIYTLEAKDLVSVYNPPQVTEVTSTIPTTIPDAPVAEITGKNVFTAEPNEQAISRKVFQAIERGDIKLGDTVFIKFPDGRLIPTTYSIPEKKQPVITNPKKSKTQSSGINIGYGGIQLGK